MRRCLVRFPLVLLGFTCGFGCAANPASPGAGEAREVSFRLTYTFTSKGRTRWAKVMALVPRTVPGRQVVQQVEYSPAPLRVIEVEGTRYAEFLVSRPAREFQVRIAGKVKLWRHDLSSARRIDALEDAEAPNRCLLDEPHLQKDDPAIRKAARALRGSSEIDTVRRIYDFVIRRMEHTGFEPRSKGGGAVDALRTGKGDCTDYADLMVALCRARGIPARAVLGIYASRSVDVIQHSWVEVYLRTRGWVPFDPTVDDCTAGRNASFEKLKPLYIRFSAVRNDQIMEYYNAYAVFHWWGDPITLREKYEVE